MYVPFTPVVTGLKQDMEGVGVSVKLQRTSYSGSMHSPRPDKSCWSSVSYLERGGEVGARGSNKVS